MELLNQLRRQYNYAYWCGAKAPQRERLWWSGYLECLKHVIELMKEVSKR